MALTPLVKQFLADKEKHVRARGGPRCLTCDAAARRQIEAECKAFNSVRKGGKTLTSWTRFLDLVLRPHFKLKFGQSAIMRHLRTCLGWTLH